MSKGHKQRDRQVSYEEWEKRHAIAFPPKAFKIKKEKNKLVRIKT
jgi:hypothetical protein